MPRDEIEYKILPDGTISMKTPGVSKENHLSADQLLAHVAKLAGGSTKKSRLLTGFHTHLHDALDEHTADGHEH